MTSYCEIDRSILAGEAAGEPEPFPFPFPPLCIADEEEAREEVEDDKSYPLTPAAELAEPDELALTLRLAGCELGPDPDADGDCDARPGAEPCPETMRREGRGMAARRNSR